jgi:hypothetical protein
MKVDLPLSISMKLAANKVEDTSDLTSMMMNTIICQL